MKTCNKCAIEKPLEEFHKKTMGYLGYNSICKICVAAKSKESAFWKQDKHRAKQLEYKAANREIIREKDKAYEQKNAEAISNRRKKYRQENREKVSEQRRRKYLKNKDKEYAYHYNKLKTDENYYLKTILRARVNNFLRGNGIKAGSAVNDLGCTISEFKAHLESKFTEGMSWENRGQWHIDHIIPLCKFDLTNRNQFLKACHYTNMQPLWAIDNLRKNKF